MHKILLILLLALCLTPLSHSNASEKNQPLMVGDLLYVPVLYDGRIMPLDSFAEITFEKIAGKKLKNSAKYLTQTIFNPEVAIHAKIFTIPNACAP